MDDATVDEVVDLLDLPVDRLAFGLSPRFLRVDEAHVAALTEVFDLLPPILVAADRHTVIDGVHRTSAARMLGRATIRAQVFAGDSKAAVAEAIARNIRHGLPLTNAERKAAVRQLVETQPDLSDRHLSEVCGLSASTVASLRRSTAENLQLNRRVGRDGRSRPTDPATQREQIAAVLRLDLMQPVRQVAAATGSSPATVLDVRRRIVRGASPIPDRLQPPPEHPVSEQRHAWAEDKALVAEPKLREFTEWFERSAIFDDDWTTAVACVPLGRIYQLIDEANARAASWRRFAENLGRRTAEAR